MYVKIQNKLKDPDFVKLVDVLKSGTADSFELFPGFDFGFVRGSRLVVSTQEAGYSVSTSIFFDDPIGNTVCLNVGIVEQGLQKSYRKIQLNLRKPQVDTKELVDDIAYSLSLIERIVNYTCGLRGEAKFDVFVIDYPHVARQLGKSKIKREMELRGEKIKPFEIIHADSGVDVSSLSDDFVPLYVEYDRWDLYGGKKAYRLLPRGFVVELLKCQGSTLLPENQFNEKEKEVLRDLVKKRQIKRAKAFGKFHYCELEDKTRTYLVKALRKKSG